MILCLTGLPGSGKSTAAEVFSKMGFEVMELSGVIKEEMQRRGVTVTNESLEEFANRMKKENGRDVFAVMMGEKLRKRNDSNILVVGFRSLQEFETMERIVGEDLPLIVVSTPQKLRFKRLSERKNLPIKSLDAFMMREKSNIQMGILDLMERADFIVSNSGSREELKESIDDLIEKIGEKGA